QLLNLLIVDIAVLIGVLVSDDVKIIGTALFFFVIFMFIFYAGEAADREERAAGRKGKRKRNHFDNTFLILSCQAMATLRYKRDLERGWI
ncbi:hypothetical protein ACHAXM_003543, partial [Skeletonema potamos]